MNKDIRRRCIQVILTLLVQALLLFAAAGTFRWSWAWIFLAVNVAVLTINFFVLPREVIEERGRSKKDAKRWDKLLSAAIIVPTLLVYTCAGLDRRFAWSGQVHPAVNVAGLLLMFAGCMLFTWSMVSNRFFSTLVRLQYDRGHTVASGGPYRFVRHPGYAGYIVMTLATPPALGSLRALAFAGIISLLFVLRTALEDATLRRELDGYAAYAEKVKYRLLPLIW
jgi:protein-S-isoprenylcysteine O-methyltransferase Ste14